MSKPTILKAKPATWIKPVLVGAPKPCPPTPGYTLAPTRLNQRSINVTHDPAKTERVSLRCAASAADVAPSDGNDGLKRTLLLGAMFGGWYAFNIVFNIYNKRVLTVFPYPITCTAFQFFVGGVLGLGWFIATGRKIDTSTKILKAVLPLSIVHTLGNLLTNCSLGLVAVSFTHTIKAMEPFFSVLLSFLFLGDKPNPLVLLTLLPIVGGVAVASLSEASFNWLGFGTAMGSNVTFQSRNVLSKKIMTPDVKEQLGGSIGLFSMITLFSFFLLTPFAFVLEGFVFTPEAMLEMGNVDPWGTIFAATAAAVTFHLYQQVSYMILARVSPVTHSIGNCIKRIIVIVASVIVFRNPVTQLNAIGTATALAGVFAYSQVKRMTAQKKAA